MSESAVSTEKQDLQTKTAVDETTGEVGEEFSGTAEDKVWYMG